MILYLYYYKYIINKNIINIKDFIYIINYKEVLHNINKNNIKLNFIKKNKK